MKRKDSLLYAFVLSLGGIIVILGIASASLYRQNKEYKHVNRQLIIQNDSVLAANIELKKALNEKVLSSGFKKSSAKIKVPYQK
jgi:CHASE3 domain sensor protein